MLINSSLFYLILRLFDLATLKVPIPVGPRECNHFPDPGTPPIAQGGAVFFPVFYQINKHSPIRRDIHHTTASFKTLTCITNKIRELQRVRYTRVWRTSASDPQDNCNHQNNWFWSTILVWSIQIQEIVTHNSSKEIRTLQHHQAPYWYHQVDTLMYLGVMISQIRPTVSDPWATWLAHSSWLSHSPQ